MIHQPKIRNAWKNKKLKIERERERERENNKKIIENKMRRKRVKKKNVLINVKLLNSWYVIR